MTRSEILADSSYLFALLDAKNPKHAAAVAVAEIYGGQFVVPATVLTEVAYLFNREGGIPAVLQFIDRFTAMQARLEPISMTDLTRVREIMAVYRDSRFDFIDCCIMAQSERLKVTSVCTFDRCQEPPRSKPVMCTNTKPLKVARTKPHLRIADEKTQAMVFKG